LADGEVATRPAAALTAPLLVLLLAATSLKLFIASRTYGSNDVLYWETFLREANSWGGLGLYRGEPLFNHPPLMVRFIRILGELAAVTHVPLGFWLRAASSTADVGTFFAVVGIARAAAMQVSGWTLALLAIAPASIMIAGFHGNTDPIMVLFVVLAVLFAVRGQPAWMVGLAIGMAVNVKLAAIVFAPALVFSMADWRLRLTLAGAAAVIVALASMPYLLQDPALLERKIIAYTSIPGHWGFTRLMSLGPALRGLYPYYLRYAALATLGAIAALCFAFSRLRRPPPLFLQCGISGFLFMVFTPGFGVQYLAWLVPWAVAAGFLPALLWYSTSGIFLFAVYTYWSEQFPWYYANSLKMRDWGGSIVLAEIGAWLATAAVLVALLRRAGGEAQAADDARSREEGEAQIREGRPAQSQRSA
jgi:hypothetical protein